MLVARSVAEAHLYLDLRGCSSDRKSRLVARGDDLITIYECTCGGQPQRFEFFIPVPEPSQGRFGDEPPSTIVGPGEWLSYADKLAKAVPAQPEGLTIEQRREALVRLELAAECLDEVLKFFPPGQDRLPETAFLSEADRAVWQREPGRFQRARLTAVRDTYQQLAARFR